VIVASSTGRSAAHEYPGRFASLAYQALASIEDLTFQIAAREKAEAALRELANGLEAKLRRLVDANIIGIVIWNLDVRILEANDAVLRMVQYDHEDIASVACAGRI
jgi:PAS domain-containing protein